MINYRKEKILKLKPLKIMIILFLFFKIVQNYIVDGFDLEQFKTAQQNLMPVKSFIIFIFVILYAVESIEVPYKTNRVKGLRLNLQINIQKNHYPNNNISMETNQNDQSFKEQNRQIQCLKKSQILKRKAFGYLGRINETLKIEIIGQNGKNGIFLIRSSKYFIKVTIQKQNALFSKISHSQNLKYSILTEKCMDELKIRLIPHKILTQKDLLAFFYKLVEKTNKNQDFLISFTNGEIIDQFQEIKECLKYDKQKKLQHKIIRFLASQKTKNNVNKTVDGNFSKITPNTTGSNQSKIANSTAHGNVSNNSSNSNKSRTVFIKNQISNTTNNTNNANNSRTIISPISNQNSSEKNNSSGNYNDQTSKWNNSSNSNSKNSSNINLQNSNNLISNNSTISNQNNSSSFPKSDITPFSKSSIDTIYQKTEPYIMTMAQSSMSLNSLPFVRNILKFLVPFFAFFDDYWYYIYHDNQFYQLQLIPDFLAIMYKINSERIIPDVFNIEEIQSQVHLENLFKSSYQNYTNNKILNINQEETYFTKNIKNMICLQYPLTICIFLIVKIILNTYSFILKRCIPKNAFIDETSKETRNKDCQLQKQSFFLKIQIFFEKYADWSNLIVLFIEANIILIVFNAGLQFNVFFGFNFADKMNLAISTFYLFLCLLYGFGFYWIIYESNLHTKIFLTYQGSMRHLEKLKVSHNQFSNKKIETERQKKQRIQFYVLIRFQTYFVCLKSLFFGFAHSVFLQSNYIQLGVLSLFKIILIGIAIIVGKRIHQKRQKWIFFSGAIYFMMGIAFDMLLVLSKLKYSNIIISLGKDQLNLMEKIIIFSLLLSVLIEFCVYFWNLVVEIFCTQEPSSQKSKTKSSCSINDNLIPVKGLSKQSLKQSHFISGKILKKKVFEFLNQKSESVTPEPFQNELIFYQKGQELIFEFQKKTKVVGKFKFYKKKNPPTSEIKQKEKEKENLKHKTQVGRQLKKKYIKIKKITTAKR